MNQRTANYAAKYCLKKMTAKDDGRLKGLHPEFTRMSKMNGGLGIGMLPLIAKGIEEQPNYDVSKDVPHSIVHGRKSKPLGRYLRGKLRESLGRDYATPQSTLDEMAARVLPVRAYAYSNSLSFAETLTEVYAPERANLKAKIEIFSSKVKL